MANLADVRFALEHINWTRLSVAVRAEDWGTVTALIDTSTRFGKIMWPIDRKRHDLPRARTSAKQALPNLNPQYYNMRKVYGSGSGSHMRRTSTGTDTVEHLSRAPLPVHVLRPTGTNHRYRSKR